MSKFVVPLVLLLALVVTFGTTGCGGEGESDEEVILGLIDQQIAALNDLDLQTVYEMKTPNYRAKATYQEYETFMEQIWGEYIGMAGTKELKASDISMRVEGEWAYVTSKLTINGDVLLTYTDDEPDIMRKVDGQWYDVEEFPADPGYNTDDLPK